MLNDQTMKEVYAPLISIVSAPQSCVTPLGKMILEADVDLTARLLFMQKMHKTHPGTGAVCTAAAIRIPGSIPHRLLCRSADTLHGRSFTSAIRPGSWTSRASVIWRPELRSWTSLLFTVQPERSWTDWCTFRSAAWRTEPLPARR